MLLGGGGLHGHEKAPSNRSICFLCDNKIPKSEWRLEYAISESSNLRDRRRIHLLCAGKLPLRTRAVDQAYLQDAIAATAVAEELAALGAAHDALALADLVLQAEGIKFKISDY